MKEVLNRFVAHPGGAFALLLLAAFLEAYGDSFFQTALHRSSGSTRVLSCVVGAAVLALYGFTVNVPEWDFGKLIGLYVAAFFLMAQAIARIKFHQSPTPAIYLGGSLIVMGGAVIAFWKP